MSVCLSASLFPYPFPSLVVGKADNPQEAEVGAEPVSLLSIAALSCLCALDKGMDWLSSQGLIHLQLLPGAAQKMWVGWDHPSGCCCSAYSSLGDVCVYPYTYLCVCVCVSTHMYVCVCIYTHISLCVSDLCLLTVTVWMFFLVKLKEQRPFLTKKALVTMEINKFSRARECHRASSQCLPHWQLC